MDKNNINKLIVKISLVILTACLPSLVVSQEKELIIPMPGSKQIEKAKEKPKKKDNTEDRNSDTKQSFDDNSIPLIPLPDRIKKELKQTLISDKNNKKTPETTNVIIKIPKKPTPSENQPLQNFPKIPDEVVVESDSITEPVELPSDQTSNVDKLDNTTEEYPVFPKDTSSPIFMIMKTWQCKDYDGNQLLSHAVEVYSQEAGESFQIKGLDPQRPFLLNLDEEDITLDELLDLIAIKTGRDWGSDVANRTIYFYPKRIETNTATSW